MEIESLAGRIRCEKNPAMAFRERSKHRGSLVARQAAVQNSRGSWSERAMCAEGVPIFSIKTMSGSETRRISRPIAPAWFRAPRRRPLRGDRCQRRLS